MDGNDQRARRALGHRNENRKVSHHRGSSQLARPGMMMNFHRDEMKLEGLSAHARYRYRAPIACANVVWSMREMFTELVSIEGRHESTQHTLYTIVHRVP